MIFYNFHNLYFSKHNFNTYFSIPCSFISSTIYAFPLSKNVFHVTTKNLMTFSTYAITRLNTTYYCSPAVMLHRSVRLPTTCILHYYLRLPTILWHIPLFYRRNLHFLHTSQNLLRSPSNSTQYILYKSVTILDIYTIIHLHNNTTKVICAYVCRSFNSLYTRPVGL